MTKVLIFISLSFLIFGGNFLRADDFATPFVQTESNIEAVEENLNTELDQIKNLPLDSRSFLDFNFYNVAPPAAAVPPIMVRINIFPVLDYRTKSFMFDMGSSGEEYHKSIKLDGAIITSTSGVHLTTLDGKIIGDGQRLSFKISKNNSTFSLDNRTGAFTGIILTQDPAVITHVFWQSVKGPVALNYLGNLIITPNVTPRGDRCIKIVNVLELERYISLVTPM